MDSIISDEKEKIDQLLDKVLTSRIQRRAKGIIRSGLNFLMTSVVVLLSASEFNPNSNEDAFTLLSLSPLAITVCVSAFFMLALCIFLFFHAAKLPPHTRTEHEVENAYASTNKYPTYDGILELRFPAKFRGTNWWFAYIITGMCVAILFTGFGLWFVERDRISNTTTAALFSAASLLENITSDFSEYWVYTRNQEPKAERKSGDVELLVNAE